MIHSLLKKTLKCLHIFIYLFIYFICIIVFINVFNLFIVVVDVVL